ncbi:DNA polymerase III subunit beta [bacterium]|nr:DNA polymerase III subunit beta [bacterium]
MKFTCLQENLNKGLVQVGRIATTKSSLPILENVLLKTENGMLKLVATDLEAVIVQWIGGKIEEEGSITVPCRLFGEYISSLPNNKLTIEAKDGNDLTISADEYEATIKGESPEDFPIIPEVKEKVLTKLNSKQLAQSISEVSFAAALDDSRPVLSGVLFSFDKKTLKIVATDSYRLAEKKVSLSESVLESKQIIIPAKTISEIQRVLNDEEGDVEIKVGDSQILFHTKNVDIIARLIDGNFPDYKKIIPAQYSTRATVSRDKFTSVVKSASLFARESGNNIKIYFDPKGKIIVSTQASQVGDNTSQTESLIEGTEGDIAFNSRYLLDVLSVIKSSKLVIETSGKLKPGVLKPEGKDDYVHIIMPLSV